MTRTITRRPYCTSCCRPQSFHDFDGTTHRTRGGTPVLSGTGRCSSCEATASTMRRIASEWHGGQSSPLYAFTSTGAIVDGLEAEMADCAIDAHWQREGLEELRSLAEYVAERGPRGPQPGWAYLDF